MLIQCPQCDTTFRLDEKLLPAEGSRVRCSRCNQVFRSSRRQRKRRRLTGPHIAGNEARQAEAPFLENEALPRRRKRRSPPPCKNPLEKGSGASSVCSFF